MNTLKILITATALMISLPAFAQNPFSFEAEASCADCSIAPVLQEKSLDKLTQSYEELDLSRVFLDKNGKDPRKEVEPVGVYGTIGKIESRNGKIKNTGTAFLVSPCHVLTAAHAVLIGTSELKFISGHFYFGKDGKGRTGAQIVAFDQRYLQNKNPTHDWALLALDECIGAPVDRSDIGGRGLGWMEFTGTPQASGKPIPVRTAGYFFDRQNSELTNQLFVDDRCEIKKFDFKAWVWNHDCALTAGGSGGPIFNIKDGVPKVFGVNVAELIDSTERPSNSFERDYYENYGNIATAVVTFAESDEISAALAADSRSTDITWKDNPLRKPNPSKFAWKPLGTQKL